MFKSHQIDQSYFKDNYLLTLILACFLTVYYFNDSSYMWVNWSVWLIFIVQVLLISNLRRFYSGNYFRLGIHNYLKAFIVLIVLFVLLYSFAPFTFESSRIFMISIVACAVLALPLNLLLLAVTANVKSAEYTSKKSENIDKKGIDDHTKYALVVGVGELAEKVDKEVYLQKRDDYKIIGFINCSKEKRLIREDRVVGELSNLNEYLNENHVDEIIIALPFNCSKKIKNVVAAADYYGIRVKYIPDYQGLFGNNYKAIRYGHFDAVNVRQLPLDETFSFLVKTSFDKLFSFWALLFLSPLFLIISILIKLESPGPVFYCPVRVGKGGRPFRVFKFRSMWKNDSPLGGMMSTKLNDPRITNLGKFLRRYNLDELPQFLNVFLGHMSVVGPRPHRSYLNKQLQESVNNYMIRHYFKPGITGWAQVNGWRGPTETDEQRCQRTQHDLWYMENWSLLLDIKIICLTVFAKKAHKNAF